MTPEPITQEELAVLKKCYSNSKKFVGSNDVLVLIAEVERLRRAEAILTKLAKEFREDSLRFEAQRDALLEKIKILGINVREAWPSAASPERFYDLERCAESIKTAYKELTYEKP